MCDDGTFCQVIPVETCPKCSYWRERTAKAEKRIAELASRLRWTEQVLSAPAKQVSPAERITAVVARKVEEQKRSGPDRGKNTTVFIPAIAEKAGLSTDVVGKSLVSLAHKGWLEREAYREGDATRIAISATPAFLENPLNALHIDPGEERNHGGKRIKRCQACGSENLLEVSYQVCADCGTEQVDSKKVTPVNKVEG